MTESDRITLARARARRRARKMAFRMLGSSGVGAASAAVTGSLPRRGARDHPSSLMIRPFTGHRLAILAHWSSDGALDRSLIHLGENLRALDYDVLLVTTAPTSIDSLAQASSSFAFGVVTRRNEGYDFQSWRRGLEVARRRGLGFDRLVMTNGSMHGPISPMDHIVAKMDAFGTWGMTESMDFRRHIQSWWLGFGADSLGHPGFDRYWGRVRPATNKWGTILAHELRWADELSLAGPAVPYVSVEQHGCAGNPLFFGWRELIEEFGMPFVKRSLFLQNYDRVDMTGSREFIAANADGFDVSMIAPSSARPPGRSGIIPAE